MSIGPNDKTLPLASHPPESTLPAVQPGSSCGFTAGRSAIDGHLQAIEDRVRALRLLLLVAIGGLVIAGGLVFAQQQSIQRLGQQIAAMQGLADKKLEELTPKLEQRAQRVELAVERASQVADSLESRLKASEDRMLNSIEQRAPQIFDKYIEKKIQNLTPRP